ncbi:MAG TPA: hypothetical protein VF226_07645 [Hyphomicrobiaceae bacterium]
MVDRLWPRGLNREKAAIDEWAREIAPEPRAALGVCCQSDKVKGLRALPAEGSRARRIASRFPRVCAKSRAEAGHAAFCEKGEVRNSAVVLKAVLDEVCWSPSLSDFSSVRDLCGPEPGSLGCPAKYG